MKENRSFYVKALANTACQCGKTKQRRQSFCRWCFLRLPPGMKSNLYKTIGFGYEQAHDEALKFLTQ